MNITEINLQLIREMKKEGREILWQSQHPLYKNNIIRRLRWMEISNALGLTSSDCMAMWKGLKKRHSRAKANLTSLMPTIGTCFYQLKREKIKEFIKEMDYFKSDVYEKTNENSSTLSSVSQLGSTASKIIIREDGLADNHPRKFRVLLPKPIPIIAKATKQPNLTSLSQARKHKEDEEIITDSTNYSDRSAEKADEEKPYDQFGKYVAAELRYLPQLQAILLQQELQNCVTSAKLTCLEGVHTEYSHSKELLHNDVSRSISSTSPSTLTNDGSNNDFDVLNVDLMTTFEANDN